MAPSQGQGRGSSALLLPSTQLWGGCPSSRQPRLSHSLAKWLLCGHLDPISSFLPPPISGKRPWAALPISEDFSPRKPSLSSPTPTPGLLSLLGTLQLLSLSPPHRESLGPSTRFPFGSWLNIGYPWPDCEFPSPGPLSHHVLSSPPTVPGREEPRVRVAHASGTEPCCSEAWSQHHCSSFGGHLPLILGEET